MKPNFKRDKKYLIDQYESMAPEKIQTEDLDGSYYPRNLPLPAIAYIPPAEPHILVTDLYDNHQDWYDIPSFIESFSEQSFVCYYKGMYLASFLCSANCLELTIKYELVRKGFLKPESLEEKLTFGKVVERSWLKKIKLAKFSKNLLFIRDLRNGLYHFNPIKMKNAAMKITYRRPPKDDVPVNMDMDGRMEKITRKVYERDFTIPTDTYDDWSRLSEFSYLLMHEITKQLYGDSKKWSHWDEGFKDYDKRKKSR